MHDAPVVAVHGIELEGLSGGADAIGCLLGVLDEFILAHGAVVLDVHADAGCVFDVADEDAIDEVLDVLEDFSATADEGVSVFGEDLKRGAFGSLAVFDRDGKSEVSQHGVEDAAGVFERCESHGSEV